MPQNIEFMAKCAADSYMQSLIMREPNMINSEEAYLQKYMEVYNKSLSIAMNMNQQEEKKFEEFGTAANLFK